MIYDICMYVQHSSCKYAHQIYLLLRKLTKEYNCVTYPVVVKPLVTTELWNATAYFQMYCLTHENKCYCSNNELLV